MRVARIIGKTALSVDFNCPKQYVGLEKKISPRAKLCGLSAVSVGILDIAIRTVIASLSGCKLDRMRERDCENLNSKYFSLEKSL